MSHTFRGSPVTGLCLPLAFDPELLRADLAAIPPEAWSQHYNEADYGGVWRGVALRSPSGKASEIFAGAGAYFDTPLLDVCRGVREVLSVFACTLKAVRLLSLSPGSFIREHTDAALDFEDGEVRIHIPIQTNPDVEFYIAGERMLLGEGSAYYLNVNLPHRVNNRGACDRIHLVIDAEVNDWVRDLFLRGGPIPRSTQPPRGIAGFRDRVFREPGWQDALRPLSDLRGFEREAMRLAREGGFDVHEGDIGAALRGSLPAAPAGWQPTPGWAPVRFFARAARPWAEWVQTGSGPFTEPFFKDTVARRLRAPFVRFSRCEAPLAESAGAREPLGFLFHMSCCGSTLAAQMFQTLTDVSVFSEPAAVDQAIQAGNPDWLRRIVVALGGQQRFLVKLDAWHIHALPLIREAFPSVPWVVLFRDPAEVLQSQLESPGLLCVPGMVDAALLRVDPAECPAWDLAGWAARVIAAICRSAVAARGEASGLFVDYAELPEAAISQMAPHFGIPLDDAGRERMRARARFDARNPGVPFPSPATPPRDKRVDPLVREFGLDLLYQQLRAGGAPRTLDTEPRP